MSYLNIKELFKAVEDKKKIRRTSWNKEDYWVLSSDNFLYTRHGNSISWKQALYELNQGTWELFEHPKQLALLTPGSVGKVVLLTNGQRKLVTDYFPENQVYKWILSGGLLYSEYGISEKEFPHGPSANIECVY